MPKLKHPCSGMTKAQRRDFELIAIGRRPQGGYQTIDALTKAGLIEEGAPETVGRDRFGLIKIRRWFVPMQIHMWWCEWCSQNVPTDTGSVT